MTEREMTPAYLFELVLREALRDGTIDLEETAVIDAIRSLLGVTPEQEEAARLAARKAVGDGDEKERALERVFLYQKCLVLAAADGEITDVEEGTLSALKKALAITPKEHEGALASVRAWIAHKKQWED